MNKSSLIVAMFFASIFSLNAQTVVLEEEVTKAIDSTNALIEEKLQLGTMFDFTFYGGGDEKGFKGTLANSLGFNLLFNLKYKLNNSISLISQTGFNIETYAFKKADTNTIFPTNQTYDNERFTISALSLSLGARIKVYKKLYTEIGAMSKWNFSKVHNYETKDGNGNFMDVYVHDLGYIKDFNHDAYFRLGYSAINVVAYYRLNNMFQKVNYAPTVYELPRLRLGISIGL